MNFIGISFDLRDNMKESYSNHLCIYFKGINDFPYKTIFYFCCIKHGDNYYKKEQLSLSCMVVYIEISWLLLISSQYSETNQRYLRFVSQFIFQNGTCYYFLARVTKLAFNDFKETSIGEQPIGENSICKSVIDVILTSIGGESWYFMVTHDPKVHLVPL